MENLFCQYCGSQIATKERCKKCGSIIPITPIVDAGNCVTCQYCTAPNHPNAKHCYSCGRHLSNKKGSSTQRQADLQILEALKQAAKEIYQNQKVQNMNTNKNQIRIGLWGPTKAGKTVYLLSLYLAARQSGNEWLIGFDDIDPQLRTLFNQMADNLRKGQWPDPNPPEKAEPDIYNLLFYPNNPEVKIKRNDQDPLKAFWDFFTKEPSERSKSSKPGISVSFADVAGERYLQEPPESVLWNHLAGCHGLICLLDPETVEDQLILTSNLVENLYGKIKKEKPELLDGMYLPQYVSVCFTKMDRKNWMELFNDPLKVIEKLEAETSLNLKLELIVHFSPMRLKFHCLSSVGFNFLESSIAQKTSRIKPENIFAPLNEWIQRR